ncbi:hypothetical protein KAFR_0I00430 [Kazachstania africana CBS 2517]|uniref:N-glycosylase/DNA lyase n=1 Tax=Kazachstania africana (strain ATCC 22294 / BCRC 22015 / CBS 2517 / CECT 1963 / NBRC 1671 / NRRL Y-8276) TaxID=1071382 RepID=H2AZM4_KAZAF|nr:hypothetical protein KAFR_0I00430 [Kazachstania africana CBS 2517]CCF59824.1 hypothetical protein KAFR_0I00430 [Kazachstania africana CBS 2517]
MLQFGKLRVKREHLNLQNVLHAGQSFRWIFHADKDYYATSMKVGSYSEYCIVLLKQQDENTIEYASVGNVCEMNVLGKHLEDYFRLEVDLAEVHANEWIPSDSKFKGLPSQGIRILGQEPWETLISFICSSNNNISRITKMCHNLCSYYGNKLDEFDSLQFYSFPTSEDLVKRATEAELRELGFGYRAKYILETAKKIVLAKKAEGFSTDQEYFKNLMETKSIGEVKETLMSFSGVGPKVADCVCLMGLRMDHVVPVDVHVGRIAKRDYQISASKMEISKLRETYSQLPITKKKINLELDYIGLQLTKKWGRYAGWAQGLLFFKEIGGASGVTTNENIKRRRSGVEEVDTENKRLSRVKTETVTSEIKKL